MVWIAGLIYAVAWFCPVIEGDKTLADGVLPGWRAFVVALSPLWEERDGSALQETLFVCSGITNIAFVLGFGLLLRRPAGSKQPLAWLLLISAAVDSHWIFETGDELRVGYWMWLGSFVLLWWVARARPATAPSRA